MSLGAYGQAATSARTPDFLNPALVIRSRPASARHGLRHIRSPASRLVPDVRVIRKLQTHDVAVLSTGFIDFEGGICSSEPAFAKEFLDAVRRTAHLIVDLGATPDLVRNKDSLLPNEPAITATGSVTGHRHRLPDGP